MMRTKLTLSLFLLATITWAQEQRAEYFLDTDPGYGLAQTISNIKLGENQLALDLSQASAGAHVLYVRTCDEEGRWSATMSRPIYVNRQHDVVSVENFEYFIDNDPGYGLGRPLASSNTGSNIYEMSFQGVETGAHVLYLRAQDKLGSWSSTLSRPIYVCQMRGIAAIEYFFDSADPGEGMANAVAVTDVKANAMSFDIDINTLTEGDHTLSVRVKSTDGRWSLLSTEPFSITNGQNGISTITFTMPLRMSLANHILTVEATDGSPKADSRVELYDVSGRRLASAVWPATSQTFTLHVNSTNTVVVKVTDLQHNKQTVKHIMVR